MPERHDVLGNPLTPPFPEGYEQAIFGVGCFWGAERLFWQTARRLDHRGRLRRRLHPEPDLRGGLLGRTGHTEAVLVVFDPAQVSYEELLRVFWEGHDPTQGMRQGNDMGTQYRSAIYDDQRRAARGRGGLARMYQESCARPGYGEITTEIRPAGEFYYAEDYHQQYLAKNPNGYCGLGGTGVSCPVELLAGQ